MCGIIGYIGSRNGTELVFDGLKRLEYRGYDSAGIALVKDGKLLVKKDVGKLAEVHERLNLSTPPSGLVIGHLRWATHGKVTRENAHPHIDCLGEIAVVHNGIIENALELRKFLEGRGHKFRSGTDTEVVAHLIEEFSKGLNFEEACKQAFSKLKGSFAILAISPREEKIIGIRKDSPLVIGINDNEIFAASDIYALLPYTKNFIFLQNYDVAILKKHGFKIENLIDGVNVRRPIEKVDIEVSEDEKGNYHHYMIKEILEQADVFERAVSGNEEKINELANLIKRAKKIFLVAAGTSYHASLAASYLLAKAGILSKSIIASEFKNFEQLIDKDTLVIAVSQSGETADVLDAVRIAKRRGAKIFSIVNVYGSSLTRESHDFLLMNAGFEIGVAATKTYIAQLAIFLKLYSKLAGKNFNPKIIKSKILELLGRSRREFISKIAEKLKDVEHIFLIGRGLQYVTALEAALKIKEVSYIHAEAFAGGELKHGTIALIEEGTPCIVFVSKENEKEIISNAMEIKSRGGYIIGISSKRHEVFDLWVKVPECDAESLILQIIPIQILAYQLAVLRGYDPDYPRSLAKAVSVK